MNLICQNNCYDPECYVVAGGNGTLWVKCTVCGKMQMRRQQEARGAVVRMERRYTDPEECVEAVGEIPDHTLPSFWAMGAYVMVGLTGLKLTQEDKQILNRTKRRAHETGPFTCGDPAAPSEKWEGETLRCSLCGGPCCARGGRDLFGKKMKGDGICCYCGDSALC